MVLNHVFNIQPIRGHTPFEIEYIRGLVMKTNSLHILGRHARIGRNRRFASRLILVMCDGIHSISIIYITEAMS